MHVLNNIDVVIKTNNLADVQVMAWICDENRFKGLKDLSKSILGIKQEKFAEVLSTIPNGIKKREGLRANSKGTYDLTFIANSYPYACDDAYFSWLLYVNLLEEIDKEEMDKIYYRTYPQFIRTLYNMELRGIDVDRAKLKRMGWDMQKDLDNLSYELLSLAGVGIDLNSTQQLAQLMFGYDKHKTIYPDLLKSSFKLPIQTVTPKGSPQVATSTFQAIAKLSYKTKRKQEGVEFCKLMVEYKKISKLKSAFVDGLIDLLYDDGKVHPSFNTVGCLVPNTLIPTTEGLIPIGEIQTDLKDDSPVPRELNIVNRNMELEKTRYVVKFENEPTIKIKTLLGLEIEGSEVHPILSSRYHKLHNSHLYRKHLGTEDMLVWKKLKELKIGDRVAVPFGYNVFSEKMIELDTLQTPTKYNGKNVKMPERLDEEVAEFMGMYYADGSLHDSNGSFSIRITNDNRDVVERVSFLSKKLFGITASIEENPDKNSVTTNITAKGISLIEDVLELKRGAVNKTIPSKILKSPKNVITAFIRGMTLDSCIIQESRYKTYLKFTLSNRISTKYLQEILLNMGIVSSLTQDRHKTDNVFNLKIYNEELEKFAQEIGFVEDCKRDINIELNPNPSPNYTRVGNMLLVPIKSLENGISDVYDFNVPETHSFISGAFISHNTDSGRISCSSPNLMQIPNNEDGAKYNVRECFIGAYNEEREEREHIISVDYSNLEVRVMAHFSKDLSLITAFKEGKDLHGNTAKMMFRLDCDANEVKTLYPNLRQQGKVIAFLKNTISL